MDSADFLGHSLFRLGASMMEDRMDQLPVGSRRAPVDDGSGANALNLSHAGNLNTDIENNFWLNLRICG